MNADQTHDNNAFNIVPSISESVIRNHSRSFSFASRILPRRVREDVIKLYAWCRWCDDAVDAVSERSDAVARLETLRADVERIYRGEPVQHGASMWLAELVDRYGICKAYPEQLLDAMDMDLRIGHISDEDELLRYAHGAAGVVGLMLCQIFEVHDARAQLHASALGKAMQLTNIARDVLEDAQRGRCYLPRTWLEDDVEVVSEQVLRLAVRKILDLADEYYEVAAAGMHYLPRDVRPAIRVASRVYREIGVEVRRRNCAVKQGRTVVSKTRFAVAAVSALACGCLDESWRGVLSVSDSLLAVENFQSFHIRKETNMNDSKYIAWLGLSLTSFMGAALFMLVLLNPKDESYSYLPLVYGTACFVFGIVANYLAKQNEAPSRASEVQRH